jgi:zinc protease
MKRFSLFIFLILLPAFAYAINLAPVPFKSSNGIQGLLLQEDALPMVTLKIAFPHAGGVSDPQDKTGRAHFASHLLMEGAGRYSAAELSERLEIFAIRMSMQAHEDNLLVTVRTLKEHLPEAIRLAGLVLSRPRFDPQAMERVREKLLSELSRAKQSPAWQAAIAWQGRAYGSHPYATPLQGTEAGLKAIRRQDLESWQMQSLTRQNMQLSVVGDVSTDRLTALLDEHFDAMPEKLYRAHISKAPAFPQGREPHYVTTALPQSVAVFGYEALPRSHPDFYAAYLMNHILGGGSLTSRLSRNLRQQSGLVYSVYSHLHPQQASSVLRGSFATRHANLPQALEQLQQVLSHAAAQGFTKEELENAQNYLTGSFPLALDSQNDRAGYLVTMQAHRLGHDYLQKRNDYFRAVTLEQLNRVATEMLSTPPLIVIATEANQSEKDSNTGLWKEN